MKSFFPQFPEPLMAVLLFVLVFALIFAAMFAWMGPKEILQRALWPLNAWYMNSQVMSILPAPKAVLVIAPVSKTNGATASASFDTLGYDHLTLDVAIPTADTTTDGVSVLKLSESDDTTTTVTDIVQFVGGTQVSSTVGFVLPAGKTSGNTLVKLNVDLKKRKRYLTLTVVPRTTQILAAIANLQRAEQSPISAADAGVDAISSG
jgi:hypothetical protein